ncbi:MAG: ATP-binding protein [bacterium]|nr:ATP-binding protein [bacterium]
MRCEKEKYRTLFEHTPVGLGIADIEGNLLAFNEAMMKPGKYTREDVQEINNVANLYASEEERARVLEIARTQGYLHQHEVRFLRKDGTTYDARLSLTPVQIQGRPCWQALVEDVTQRKQTEHELVRLERLRALGEMGQGVAHNFNNLLVGVLGYAQLIQMRNPDKEIAGHAQQIVESALRAKALVERLNRAVLQRDGRETREERVPVQKVMEDAIEDTRPRWKDETEARGIQVEICLDIKNNIPPVKGTRTGLYDILVNLIFNAVDALPEGGSIFLRAWLSENQIKLAVSDTGIGMTEETRKRIFEPFFTTKANIGTGLGLSTVHNTVVSWGGSVEVDSTPAKGTTISLSLPVWADAERPPENTPIQECQGKILVVDDEKIVRRYLHTILSGTHLVEAVNNGQQALEKFASNRYDIALIDLGMPDLPGNLVGQEMKKMDPDIVTVLITGWTPEENDSRLEAFDFVLLKPFEKESVFEVVRKALGHRHPTDRPL